MKLEALEKAVALQKQAYGLLLWLKQRVRTNPELLNTGPGEPFSSGDTCTEWVRRNRGAFPQELRPAANEIRDFGFILSSFFSTSFRVAEVRCWDNVEVTFTSGANTFRDHRHKRHTERRQQGAAEDLRRMALDALATEAGQKLTPDLFEQAHASLEIEAALTLWTYGCELVRRSQFASQGPAVHLLWLELQPKVRKNVSAESIWKAREQLVQWLIKNSLVSAKPI